MEGSLSEHQNSYKHQEASIPAHKNTEKTDKVDFWLTEAQMIIIQHRLPHLFSLVPVKTTASRIAAGSKALQQETAQFVNRKKDRPEGSVKNIKSNCSLNERKSARIRNKQRRKAQNESESISDSNVSQEDHSLEKEFSFSRQASQYDMKTQKSKEKREFSVFASEQIEESEYQAKPKKEHHRKKELLTTPQTRCDKKETLGKEANQMEIHPEISIDIPKLSQQNRQKRVPKSTNKNKPSVPTVNQPFRAKDKHEVGQSVRKQQKTNSNELDEVPVPIQMPDSVVQLKFSRQNISEELQSKLIQQKFGAEIQILKQLKSHEQILPFLQPVDQKRDGAPDYYATIDDPIDLQTIEFKLANNIYKDPSYFHMDIQKMWSNSKQYNNENPLMMKVTNRLQKFYLRLAKSALQTKQKKEAKGNRL